jgi:hypothetical protein
VIATSWLEPSAILSLPPEARCYNDLPQWEGSWSHSLAAPVNYLTSGSRIKQLRYLFLLPKLSCTFGPILFASYQRPRRSEYLCRSMCSGPAMLLRTSLYATVEVTNGYTSISGEAVAICLATQHLQQKAKWRARYCEIRDKYSSEW